MNVIDLITKKILNETIKLQGQFRKRDDEFNKLSISKSISLPLSSGGESKFDLIAINNSFILRSNKLKTIKSKKYLSILSKSPDSANDLLIAYDLDLKSDWSFISSKNKNFPRTFDFTTEINNEISQLGKLIYILIGETGELPIVACKFNNKNFDSMVLDTKVEVVELKNNSIYINPNFDDNYLWDELKNSSNLPIIEIDNIENDFLVCLQKLRTEVKLPLYLPDKSSSLENTFLDNISNSISDEISKYETSLKKWQNNKDDEANFNEILRISYNFVDDAIKLLRFVISISDLKPILLWMTLNSQYNVKEAFNKLDFQNSNKPSLDDYSSMIKGARNHSFHNLFKLNNTIEVDLEGVNIKAKRLTFFEEFKKTPNSFEFEDQQLINVLTEFNRTSEKFLPDNFWSKNLEVMRAIHILVHDICESLKLLCLVNR